MKVAVIRAEHGRVEESLVFEARLEEVVKDMARHALEEWDPGSSDFLVIRDDIEVTVVGDVEEDVLKELEAQGRVEGEGGETRVLVPIYYISFDNEMIDDENYIDKRILVIAPLVYKGFKDELEAHAASMTAPPQRPGGIKKV
ncbi:hypothetical protein APE_1817.1 [Aeropyrum pernix K1]|uniref:DUF2286 domain-containing protein n=1 Tax=Aeropyrum pernix (strain ATCC 700893 / DSM 11879 / JCM 9820 / NBRC 100138 / K1) TaxID=272557 RepID=Q9YAX8_AERPE|nr:DUF2286 domain-containing protein [Aeropyrum pernix]BAA80820.2 hypothetical protein APE_1817.1 [Aeropyrum pernix K1]